MSDIEQESSKLCSNFIIIGDIALFQTNGKAPSNGEAYMDSLAQYGEKPFDIQDL
jgi:hypothetical protein